MMLSKMENMMRPKEAYNIELSKDKADDLKRYLKGHHIYFEPSEAGHLVYIVCHLNDIELDLVNEYLARKERGGWQ